MNLIKKFHMILGKIKDQYRVVLYIIQFSLLFNYQQKDFGTLLDAEFRGQIFIQVMLKFQVKL